MSPISKAIFGLALAAAVTASHATTAQTSLMRAGAPEASFVRYLPALPTDVPWLDMHRVPRTSAIAALPEAGSVDALLLRIPVPKVPAPLAPDPGFHSAWASMPPVRM
jgi:hypothetical protein